jgi:hypothetical protein
MPMPTPRRSAVPETVGTVLAPPGTERSSITPLLLVIVVMTASLSVAVAALGGAAVATERAQAAADATALVAAVAGMPAAAEVAEANGAVLLAASTRDGDDPTWVVRLQLGGATASAAAAARMAGSGN